MRLVTKSQELFANSTALVFQQQAERRSVFMMIVICQWASQGPVIKAALFHCVSSVADAIAPDKLKRRFTTNHSHMKNKSADDFKILLVSHNK